MNKKSIGEAVKKHRIKYGITQTELGIKIGMNEKYAQSRICRIEKGYNGISISMAKKISDALSCKTSEILAIK